MRLYIAGPMTGLPKYNFPAFFAADEALRAAGFNVANPATTGVRAGWIWKDYMAEAIALLVRCDGVALLPGWSDSRGACLEANLAGALGMLVKPLDCWLRETS